MKTVHLSLTQPPATRHPMHQFVVETAGYEVSELLQTNYLEAGTQTSLFHVHGWPVDPYEAALEATPAVLEYDVSPRRDETFYLYVRTEPTDQDDDLIDAVRQEGLIVLTPIEYRADGTIRLTIVGTDGAVQQTVDDVPDDFGVEVLAVGEYGANRLSTGESLTERQYEAVSAAVDCGYYEEPREGSVADVADALDCATGTAAELLRRAEAAVMADVVE